MNIFVKIKEYIWIPTKKLENTILRHLELRDTPYTLDELYETLPVKSFMFTYTRIYDVTLSLYERRLIERVVVSSKNGLSVYIARKA